MSKQSKSKSKGNAYERKVSKELSKWMFNDDTILFRDATSGARGTIGCAYYRGDVVPVRQMIKWNQFKFLIELKHGYNNDVATFYNQTRLRQWITKAISELTSEQCILLLIVKHDYKKPYVIMNVSLDCLDWNVAINIDSHVYFCYEYKAIIALDIGDFIIDLNINTNK